MWIVLAFVVVVWGVLTGVGLALSQRLQHYTELLANCRSVDSIGFPPESYLRALLLFMPFAGVPLLLAYVTALKRTEVWDRIQHAQKIQRMEEQAAEMRKLTKIQYTDVEDPLENQIEQLESQQVAEVPDHGEEIDELGDKMNSLEEDLNELIRVVQADLHEDESEPVEWSEDSDHLHTASRMKSSSMESEEVVEQLAWHTLDQL